MKRRAFIGLAAAAMLTAPATAGVAAAAPGSTTPGSTTPGDTRLLLQRALTAEHEAGMPGAFAQVRDGHRTWRVAAGVADVQTGAPAGAHMRHRVGSITKTFVATTVLQLAAERRLRLDAPIGRYLPELVPGDTGRQVTVRMLLNHTSGLGNYTATLLATLEGIVETGRTTYTPEELVRIGLARPATNAPGAIHSYSNTNYILLGLLVEKVTGHSYESEVHRRILRPLGLRDTYFEGAEPVIRGPHMSSYVPWTDGELRDFSAYNMTWAWAAGEMVSTAHDLNRFYRALLSGRLLPPAQLAQMQRTVVMDPRYPDSFGYGLGLLWTRLPCGVVWGHTGGTIGHTTISLHSPDGKRQVTLAENMNFYALPDEVSPIDVAREEFLVTALCGPQPPAAARTAARNAAVAVPLLTAGVSRPSA